MKDNFIYTWLEQFNLQQNMVELLGITIVCCFVLFVAATVTIILRQTLLPLILNWVRQNNYQWDDALVANNLFKKASWFIPVMIISLSLDLLLLSEAPIYILIKRITMTAYVIVAVLTLTALLNSINDIHKLLRKSKTHALQAYIDAAKIIAYVLGAIFITSIFTGKSPWGIFSVLGGLTAVTMLVFKDSILGFVASIQLTSTDMLQVGDWIEMEKYGADGDVVSMSIHSVRVQNWDKTITTIPTHALVSSSFKNWRGMSESGGRRIKRSLFIDISSIRFCDEQMIERFSSFELIKEYIESKTKEINEDNKTSDTSIPINGRKQTNVGVFRAYVVAYLKKHKNIHHNMTFLVRQRPPRETGLPLEIYVFSNDQVWANYEAIQGDIFDHLLAAAPQFDLRVFQNPTGYDMHSMFQSQSTNK